MTITAEEARLRAAGAIPDVLLEMEHVCDAIRAAANARRRCVTFDRLSSVVESRLLEIGYSVDPDPDSTIPTARLIAWASQP